MIQKYDPADEGGAMEKQKPRGLDKSRGVSYFKFMTVDAAMNSD